LTAAVNSRQVWAAASSPAVAGGEHRPAVAPRALLEAGQGAGGEGGQDESAPGAGALGVAVGADRPPDRDASGARVVQVDALPQEGAGFLGADAGAEGQGDVRADPGAGAGLQQGGGLVEGEGLAGPARLTFGGVGELGGVDRDIAPGLSTADDPLQREVAHRDHRGAVGRGHVR
jgi:hypothetical protein